MKMRQLIFFGVLLTLFSMDQRIHGSIIENNAEEELLGSEGKHAWGLSILPAPGNHANVLVRRVEDTLNLTCTIYDFDIEDENATDHYYEQMFKLSWYLPFALDETKNRVSNVESRNRNSLHLVVNDLKESDSGNYTCHAEALSDSFHFIPPTEYVHVKVKPKKGSCNDPLYSCPSGECIGRIFLCDGRTDCKDRSDESPEQCGTWNRNTCEGKLRCENGRCISKHWCCDRQTDRNCTVRTTPKCCLQLQSLNLDVNQYSPQPHHSNDMGFLQTTIYTVIGCAMAFMFIITIMVIAICRVHLKRTAIARYPHHLSQAAQRQDSWGNIFLHSGGGFPYTSGASGLLVTYNINNGVQFVGRPVNPPPYSEILRVPPREGPPPPYVSTENIASGANTVESDSEVPALGQQSSPVEAALPSRLRRDQYIRESDPEEMCSLEPLLANNNGDINGNSTEGDITPHPHRNSFHDAEVGDLNNPGVTTTQPTAVNSNCSDTGDFLNPTSASCEDTLGSKK